LNDAVGGSDIKLEIKELGGRKEAPKLLKILATPMRLCGYGWAAKSPVLMNTP